MTNKNISSRLVQKKFMTSLTKPEDFKPNTSFFWAWYSSDPAYFPLYPGVFIISYSEGVVEICMCIIRYLGPIQLPTVLDLQHDQNVQFLLGSWSELRPTHISCFVKRIYYIIYIHSSYIGIIEFLYKAFQICKITSQKFMIVLLEIQTKFLK